MFVIPTIAIKSELVPNQLQQNAVDITCDHMYCFSMLQSKDPSGINWCRIPKEGKTVHSDRVKMITQKQYDNSEWKDDSFVLVNTGAFAFESDVEVEIPEGYVGWLITRSSLNRNGIIVHSGLYDSGFKGIIAGTVYNMTKSIVYIERGARIAQFVLAKAECAGLYNGQYQATT